jgi:hypothetical protein
MGKTAILYTCAHSHPEVPNDRADWMGEMIADIQPDIVFDLGDTHDMPSLSSHDTRYPKAMVAAQYGRDIEHGLEFLDRMRAPMKRRKRKRPFYVGMEGNHEYRIKKAIAHDPRLEGSRYGVSFSHLQTDYFYDEYHEYENTAPKVSSYEGVCFAHYVASGNYGTAMSGIHHAYGLVQKLHNSVVVGHSHKRGMYFKDDARPSPSIGLVAGCFKGKAESWAGQANNEWWKGCVILRGLECGSFDPEFVSLSRMEEAYG